MASEKQPMPHNTEAEQQLLGALMTNNGLLAEITDIVTFEDLFDPVHQRIFEAIERKIDGDMIASPVSLKLEFIEDEGLIQLGGAEYLVRLVSMSISAFAVRDYAHIIKDLSSKRELINRMKDAMWNISAGQDPAATIALKLENQSGQIAATTSKKKVMASFRQGMTEAINNINEAYQSGVVQGTKSGIPNLDKVVGSFFPEDLIVLGGRPGMGKSAVAQSIVLNVALSGKGVFNANIEMSNDQNMHRAISSLLARKGIALEYNKIRNNVLSAKNMEDIVKAAHEYQHLPIETADKTAKDLRVLRSSAKQAARKFERKGIEMGLLVIDYLQLLRHHGARSEIENINEASLVAKSLAQDLKVPVILLSQLNREVEKREVPIPTLADLRGSGSIEQDADVVCFVYRPEYYLMKDLEAARGDHLKKVEIEAALADCRNDVHLIVDKQRMGPPKTAIAEMHIGLNHIGSMPDSTQDFMPI